MTRLSDYFLQDGDIFSRLLEQVLDELSFQNLLHNGSFTVWPNGTSDNPESWQTTYASVSETTNEGMSCVNITNDSTSEYALFYQSVTIDEFRRFFRGKKATFLAEIKTSGSGIRLSADTVHGATEENTLSEPHSGNGNWETVYVKFNIPDEDDLNKITVGIRLPVGTSAMFRNARLFTGNYLVGMQTNPDDLSKYQPKEYFRQQTIRTLDLQESGGYVSWDLDKSNVARITLNGDYIVNNPTNMKDGGTYILILKQDSTGGRSITFDSSFKWPGGTAPSLTATANAIDIVSFVSDGTNMYGNLNNDYS